METVSARYRSSSSLSRGIVFLLLLLIFFAIALRGQQSSSQPSQTHSQSSPAAPQHPQPNQQAPAPKFAVETKMVTVFATVHDKRGEVVSNLNTDDFAVDEDGRSACAQQ